MAEMKKAVVKALKFESIAKNRDNSNNGNRNHKIVPKELKFYDNPMSFNDLKPSNDVNVEFSKMLNPNHRSFNSKENAGQSRPTKMLIYEDCSDEDEPFRSTPPNDQVIKMIVTPKAPIKSRKEFEKKVLRPKKLVYNDKENDYHEDLCKLESNLYHSTPKKSGKNEEGDDPSYYEKFIIPRKILPVNEDDNYRDMYSASQALNSASASGRGVQLDKINRSRSQGSRKKNINRGLQESRRINNVQTNDLNYNKENNATHLRAEDLHESHELNSNVHKPRSNVNTERNFIFPRNREDFNTLSRMNELTHYRI